MNTKELETCMKFCVNASLYKILKNAILCKLQVLKRNTIYVELIEDEWANKIWFRRG